MDRKNCRLDFDQRHRDRTSRGQRGVTMIELMFVVGIISLLSVLLIAGYRKMQSGYRASSAYTKIESTLHYARNLAIANNAVYHVRFENVDPVTQQPVDPQAIAIYCFPDMPTALSVTQETGIHWNPTNSLNGGTVTHNNYLVERVILPAQTYYGVQYLAPSQSPYDRVLYFKPDGTLSGAGLVIFVTDYSDFVQDRSLASGDFDTVENTRRAFINTHVLSGTSNAKPQPWIKLIQVFGGGMIKMYTPAGGGQL